VRRDLAHARVGQLVGPDGRTSAIRTARIDQGEIEALIESGCPVVTYFPGGRWESVDGVTAVVLVWNG
jgi:hypothetical protein